MKKQTQDIVVLATILLILFASWIYFDLYTPFKEKQFIKKNPQVTKALITKYDNITIKGADQAVFYRFYTNNNTKNSGMRHQHSFNFSKEIENKYAYVVYNGDDPKYSFLLLYKDDFEAFKLPQPDSIFMRQK